MRWDAMISSRKRMGMSKRFFLFCFISCLAATAWPCDVPVFRYAIERWAPDVYDVFVIYDGELSDEHIEWLTPLLETEASKPGGYNYLLHLVDVQENFDVTDRSVMARPPSEFPWLLVRFPRNSGVQEPLLSAPMTKEVLDTLVDSPARKTISDKLIEGESAVWLFLESGDEADDTAAFETLSREVERLQSELALPELDERAELESIYLDTEIKSQLSIHFSIIRMSRDDPAEQAFVAQLLKSEPDLYAYDQPMAFPVFGQGRLLYAFVGDGINRETLTEAGQFLVGPCSCQIKDDNPGMDLLMPAAWAEELDLFMVRDRPTPAPIPALAMAQAAENGDAQNAAVSFERTDTRAMKNLLYALGGFALFCIAVSGFFLYRQFNHSN